VNYDLFKAINDLSGNSTIDSAMKFAAKDVIFVVIAILAVLCLLRLWRRSLRPVVATGAALVVTFLLGLLAAALYSEKRPFQTHKVHQLISHAPGQSFPSDHATAAFGIALAVLVFLSWQWGVVLLALGVLIGFARVYDGIHYPGDIGGSFLAALVGVGLVALVARRVTPASHSGRHARNGLVPGGDTR
jgi:undecaprenyl-diphosphatase